ncbi:MAG: rRNA adenine dimethyltransferase family protein [Actinomycetota bacterium]
MALQGPRSRPQSAPHRGQHFLKSRSLAAELVTSAGIQSSDLVVEIGAGRGKITSELMAHARRVIAIENDARLAGLLIERFASDERVMTVAADALAFPMIAEEFRVFGNIPFGITTRLLRRLLSDPSASLVRADLIVQSGAAMKRVRRRGNMLNLVWGPWWKFDIERSIPRTAFDPMPSVNAAMLRIIKRPTPLVPVASHLHYVDLVEGAFADGRPLRLALKPRARRAMSQNILEDLGDARSSDLDLRQWIALFDAVTRQ